MLFYGINGRGVFFFYDIALGLMEKPLFFVSRVVPFA
jgi:hypothetical protein